nr:PAS-domain containing protein [Shimia biformata]
MTHVHPLEENAGVLGRSLAEVPAQVAAVERAKREQQVILDGPTRLLQGYDGYVIREPILVYSGDDQPPLFRGVVSVVMSAEQFYQQAGMDAFAKRFDFAIRRKPSDVTTGQDIYGDQALFGTDAIQIELQALSETWQVAALPIGGWATISPHARNIMSFWLVAGLLACGVYHSIMTLRLRNQMMARRLSNAVAALPDGFALFDSEDRLVLFNEKFREIYKGASSAIVEGATFREILEYGLTKGLYQEAKGREQEWLETRLLQHKQADGAIAQALSDGRHLRVIETRTPDGGRAGIWTDNTELVQSRERAELAERRFKDAIEALPFGFWLYDADFRLLMINSAARAMYPRSSGYVQPGEKLEDLLRKGISKGQYPDAIGREEEWLKERMDMFFAQSGAIEETTAENLHLRGENRRTSEGGMASFRVDVTDLKRQEEALTKANAELTEALAERDELQERFRDLSDLSAEWFWEVDADDRIVFISEGFSRSTGIPVETLFGKRRSDLFDVGAKGEARDERDRVRSALSQRRGFSNYITKFTDGSGAPIWMSTSGRPKFGSDGEFQGYRGVSSNVTWIYSSMRAAQEADQSKTDFLNSVSHELRTPLTVMLGYNAFLTKPEFLPAYRELEAEVSAVASEDLETKAGAFRDEVVRLAERIGSSGNQLMQLIVDILDLSKIEADTMRIERAKVQPVPVVESVLSELKSLHPDSKVTITENVDDAPLWCDELRFRQILINLVGNALKFTESGEISVKSRPVGDMIQFEVKDTGTGIPQEALPNIFERFVQADTSQERNSTGLGLGLAITHELVKLHGGSISVSSEMGVGTVFKFTLPRWDTARDGNGEVNDRE